jgi:aminoglycoside/choline kinase family phosphotransferase
MPDRWPIPHVETYFAEEENGVPVLRPPWGRAGWYREISEWAEYELAKHDLRLAEPLQQMKQWDISSVLKGRTETGDVYVKAIPTLFATEPRITAGLSRLFPGAVPEPLATYERPDEGRLLLRDFGGKILWDPGVERDVMDDALRLLARMQIECAHRTDQLFAIGCADRRLQGMREELRALMADDTARARLTEEEIARLQDLLPAIEETCARLLSGPVPQTLLHGDFHSGNVATTDSGLIVFDWTDACVCHPFFDLVTVVDNEYEPLTEEQRERYLTGYLHEWEIAGYGSAQSLREMCDLALRLAPLYHAISYWHIDKICEQPTQAEIGMSMGYFIRLLIGRLEKEIVS